MMWAIYYHHPDTGVHYPCISSGHRTFAQPGYPPALFESKKNALKAIYDQAKMDHDWKKRNGNYLYRSPTIYNPGEAYDKTTIPFEIDYHNWHVVPVTITPDFDNADTEGNVLTARQRKALGLDTE
jgi:hypothetical protein